MPVPAEHQALVFRYVEQVPFWDLPLPTFCLCHDHDGLTWQECPRAEEVRDAQTQVVIQDAKKVLRGY
jgi:hypothetical protein